MKKILSSDVQKASCNCSSPKHNNTRSNPEQKTTARVIWGTLSSVLIAFFPKCPVCWAAYMSVFGSVGLTNIPYMKWILPILMAFLGLHLYFIFRKTKEKGYGPFVLSVIGALIMLGVRTFFPFHTQLLFVGISLVFVGSMWSSFSYKRLAKTD